MLKFFAAKLYLLPFFAALKPGDACDLSNSNFFFVLPPWWEFLNGKIDELNVCKPAFTFPHVVLPIGLAIIDMLTRVAGLIAIVYVIYGGVNYITSSGNAEKTAAARAKIFNALIGLAVVFAAAATVAFIGNTLD
jgi:hypothetical protein